MKILNDIRCDIGEGPIWNEKEQLLYFTNGFYKNEICTYDFKNDKISTRECPFGVAAIAFDVQNRMIVSHSGGVHVLNKDNSLTPVYDNSKYCIKYANDMKVGPDGAIYVGTQSEKRKGISDKINGKLYRISPEGEVTVLLDGLILSNGMEWSVDETKFYHTDSDTSIIREYHFNKTKASITATGRQISVFAVDGFTIGKDEHLYIGCWGQGHVAKVDTKSLELTEYIKTPAKIPTSCGFCGEKMNILAITTALYTSDIENDKNAGCTLLNEMTVEGRRPYLYGQNFKNLI